MTTRNTQILRWAEQESSAIIDAIPPQYTTRRHTADNISRVCKALITRRPPLAPTAQEVSEAGQSKPFLIRNFPATQTIYNHYRAILAIWRKAYDDIIDLQHEPSEPVDALLEWQPSDVDSGTLFNIGRMQRLIRELRNKNNKLLQLITDNVSLDLDRAENSSHNVIEQLAEWLQEIESDGFVLKEFGLAVSPRTGPGCIVMGISLWKGLQRMVKDFEMANTAGEQIAPIAKRV